MLSLLIGSAIISPGTEQLLDPGHRVQQGRGRECRGHAVARIDIAFGPDQDRWTSGVMRRDGIARIVADIDAAIELKRVLARGAAEHSWRRLAAITIVFGVMRADIDIDDIDAALPQTSGHFPIDVFHRRQINDAAADAGLIGDHDKSVTGLCQLLHRFDIIVEPIEIVPAGEITAVRRPAVYRTVAIDHQNLAGSWIGPRLRLRPTAIVSRHWLSPFNSVVRDFAPRTYIFGVEFQSIRLPDRYRDIHEAGVYAGALCREAYRRTGPIYG